MRIKRNKLVTVFAAILMIVATFLPSFASAAENMDLANGEYTIDFIVYKDGTKSASVMDGYTNKPAKVFVEDGQLKMQVTFNNADMIQAFQIQQDGSYVDATVINEDEDNKLRTVEFAVPDLTTLLQAKTHVVVPMIPGYDNWYDVDIEFFPDTLTAVNVENPNDDEGANDGSEPGENDGTESDEDGTNPDQGDDGTETEDPDGSTPEEEKVYTVDYSAIRADNENPSSMDNRFVKPATIKEKAGKYYLSIALTESGKEYVTGLELQKEDETWVSANSEYEIIDFELTSLEEPINAQVSMEVPMPNGDVYKNTQPFRIVLASNSDADPDENDGTTPEEEQDDEGQPETEIEKYTIDFTIFKDGTDSISVMDGYTEKPALLSIEDGKNMMYLTLKNSSWIKAFQTEGAGEMKDAEVVSEDQEADTRTVKFEVEDLSAKINAFTKVTIPEINYDNDYTVQIQFDPDSKKPIGDKDPSDDDDQPDDGNQPGDNNQGDNHNPPGNNQQSGNNNQSPNDDDDRLKYPTLPTNKVQSTAGPNPKTGDTTNWILSILLLVMSGTYIWFRFRRIRVSE
ncbi:NEAT domain-containing protein [Robertmurraya massiliosenegalensis]|uniref:NEAT domain-containing protein n=1 Tax=Robertmurraya TaxID=2837507 RepID=UPI0039A4FB8E